MQYKSPVKILSSFIPEEELHKIEFGTIKKRILAEFELSGQTTITVGAGDFSKNDIFSILENYRTQDDLKFHYLIAKNQALQAFLETNRPCETLVFKDECYKNPEFIAFVSPFLAYSTGIFFASCIQNPDLPIRFINKATNLILSEHEQLVVDPVRQAVDQVLSEIESAEKELPSTKKMQEVTRCFSSRLIKVLRLLPHNLFHDVVDLYAQYGFNYVVAILRAKPQKVDYIKYCHTIMGRLVVLQVSPVLKNEIAKLNYTFIRAKSGTTRKRILLAVLILLLLFRFCAALI